MDGARNEEDLMQHQDLQQRPRPPENNAAATDHHHRHPPLPPPKCPRCDSSNTKFCYYNNYSLSQPRYFCKGCRRYWTHGGTLRTVPIGGGCRKNKRPRIQPPSSPPLSSPTSGSTPSTQGLSTAVARSKNMFSGHMPQPAVAAPALGGSFFAGGGGSYMSSLGAMMSLPAGGNGGGINHGATMMGGGRFGMAFPALKNPAPPQQHLPPVARFFSSHQSLIPPGRFGSWGQSVINGGATSSSTSATSGLWSSGGAVAGSDQVGSSFAPNQWSDWNGV